MGASESAPQTQPSVRATTNRRRVTAARIVISPRRVFIGAIQAGRQRDPSVGHRARAARPELPGRKTRSPGTVGGPSPRPGGDRQSGGQGGVQRGS